MFTRLSTGLVAAGLLSLIAAPITAAPSQNPFTSTNPNAGDATPVNIIRNGDFSSGAKYWTFVDEAGVDSSIQTTTDHGSVATFNVSATFASGGELMWQTLDMPQLEAGAYRLQVDAQLIAAGAAAGKAVARVYGVLCTNGTGDRNLVAFNPFGEDPAFTAPWELLEYMVRIPSPQPACRLSIGAIAFAPAGCQLNLGNIRLTKEWN